LLVYKNMIKRIGLTKDSGWQFGVRKTFPSDLESIWKLFFSKEGLKYWSKGVEQDFTTFKEYSHIRTKWKHVGFKESASLQIRFIPSQKSDKTTISIHVDQLENENQREEAKKYWTKIIGNIPLLLTPNVLKD